jgi:hypothetical protein
MRTQLGLRGAEPRAPRLTVGLAASGREVLEAQRLRYLVFGEELGARLPGAADGAATAYTRDTGFWDSLTAIATQPCILARVSLATPLDIHGRHRRELARRAHGAIAELLEPHFTAARVAVAERGVAPGTEPHPAIG